MPEMQCRDGIFASAIRQQSKFRVEIGTSRRRHVWKSTHQHHALSGRDRNWSKLVSQVWPMQIIRGAGLDGRTSPSVTEPGPEPRGEFRVQTAVAAAWEPESSKLSVGIFMIVPIAA